MRRFHSPVAQSTAVAILALLLLSLTAAAQVGTEKVLYSFGANSTDGLYPFANVIFDAAGNMYGTTWEGGTGACTNGCGTIFEMTLGAKGKWAEKTLYSFQGRPSDGGRPSAALIFDAQGNLYTTTRDGGNPACNGACGTVVELSPGANDTWTESVIYTFLGGTDGYYPYAELIADQGGNFYSTTSGGGAHNKGTVFELSPSSNGWTKTILFSFDGKNGNAPQAGLIFDGAGNLYGTTTLGGADGHGTVFKLAPTSKGWKETVIHSFAGGPTDGIFPSADLIFNAGNIYSTTRNGGTSTVCNRGCGTVFELAPASGGTWTETVLYSFAGKPDVVNPFAGVIFDSAGNLYGTTESGGTKNVGGIFELSPSNGSWTETVVHDFHGWNKDGARSFANLVSDGNGNFIGTTIFGGANTPGVVFEYTP
jgi:uncharacterized repeat protein (TIGR03803 family)